MRRLPSYRRYQEKYNVYRFFFFTIQRNTARAVFFAYEEKYIGNFGNLVTYINLSYSYNVFFFFSGYQKSNSLVTFRAFW